MAILDDSDEYTYRDEEWLPGSTATFKRYMLPTDRTAISTLAYRYNTPTYTPKQIREARKRGHDLAAEIENQPIESTTLMDPRVAELAHMIVSWDGPEHAIPATFKARDAQGRVKRDENGAPVLHELAGKPAPPTAEWIARLQGDQFTRMYDHMSRIWEDGGEDEEDFRPAGDGVAESEGNAAAEGALPVSA